MIEQQFGVDRDADYRYAQYLYEGTFGDDFD